MSAKTSMDVFLVFDGNCREAIEFYATVFKQEMPKQIMTYGEAPEEPSDPNPETDGSPLVNENRDRIIYASMPLFGQNVMFCDCPTGQEHIKGNNISLTLGLSDEAEMKRIFEALANGGEVYMPLSKTFFSELFGMVCDKFSIIWQLSRI